MSCGSMGCNKQYDGALLEEACRRFVQGGESAYAVSLVGDFHLLANYVLTRKLILC